MKIVKNVINLLSQHCFNLPCSFQLVLRNFNHSRHPLLVITNHSHLKEQILFLFWTLPHYYLIMACFLNHCVTVEIG
jgi:hypothetical protein